MAKSKAEIMKEMRAKRKELGLKELRIYAPTELHQPIQRYAEKLMSRNNVTMKAIEIEFKNLTEDQKDGVACCVCGGETGAMTPVNPDNNSLFSCCRDVKEVNVIGNA